LPAQQRRRLLTRATALMAPRPDAAPSAPGQGIVVAGELQRASGMGEGARLILRALAALGVSAWAVDAGSVAGTDDLTDQPDPAIDGALPADGAPLLLHVNAPQLPLALVRLPRGLLKGRRVIGYWTWELPEVPEDWRTGVPFVHEAWVPSRFTQAAIESLLPGRVRVVPYPLALSPPAPAPLDRAAFGLPEGPVIVLVAFNLASSFERKNPLGAIAAFRLAFGTRPDRVLVLKVGNPHHFPGDFRRLQEAVADAPNIRLETRTFPPAEAHALMACADIVLSLHRSEGFGLVPAEAMLLGKPVVATAWSGNTDYMDAGCAALVEYRLVEARDPRGVFEAPGAVWAEPDVRQAAGHLTRLAESRDARAELGEAARRAAFARLGADGLVAALRGLGLAVA
jgi:glycosyltransferase involved in cell wall biosynthesis